MRRRTDSRSWTRRAGDAFDAMLSVVSPQKAGRNQILRNALPSVSNLNRYKGAARDRFKANWLPGGDSADAAMEMDLPLLRERSRDLNRNHPIASGITDTIVANEIGPGIRPQAAIDYDTIAIPEDLAQDLQRRMERGFRRWAPYADYEGRNDIFDLQDLVRRQILESGEGVAIRRYKERAYAPYGLCWQLIEPDRLGTPYDKLSDANISQGVEMDGSGEPVAYWICNAHPGDNRAYNGLAATEYTRVPARDADGRLLVAHIYRQRRPGQSRGVPFFAPVIEQFEHLLGYQESEWVRARVTAAAAMFIKTAGDPYNLADINATGTQTSGTTGLTQNVEEIEPGMKYYLPPGEEPFVYNPQVPSSGYDAFVVKALQFIGASLGLPLELVLKDFSRTNYSSARAALLEARRVFRGNQEWLAKRFCQPSWEMLIEEMLLRGELPEIRNWDTYRHEWTRATWIAPGWEWVDPLKEAQATVLKLESRLGTYTDEFASRGLDFEDCMRKRAQEESFLQSLGLAPVAPAEPAPATDEPEPNEDTANV